MNKLYRLLFNNKDGFTLPEVLIGAAILGGIALVMTQMMKDQATQTVKGKLSSDIAQFRTEVQTTLQTPSHCQANFYGKTGVSAPTSITKCDTLSVGACRLSGSAVSRFPVYTTDWNPTNTRISDRIRISGLSMSIPTVTGIAIGNADLTISVQTKPQLNGAIKSESIFISIPVIVNGSTVIGCPKSFNSTLPY